MNDTQYLSIGIHAVCDTCGAVTDNAERDKWTTNPSYTRYQCPTCQQIADDYETLVTNRLQRYITNIEIRTGMVWTIAKRYITHGGDRMYHRAVIVASEGTRRRIYHRFWDNCWVVA